MANRYNCRPSTLFDINDSYTAYCFDEACAYIVQQIEEGEEPDFDAHREKHFSSFSDFYSNIL